MNASSFVSPPQLLALARELELPSCVCEQLVQTAVPALLDACAAQCMALTAPDTAFPAWKHLEAQFSGVTRMAADFGAVFGSCLAARGKNTV